jgi:hypothetical protein
VNKQWMIVLLAAALLPGCASVKRGAIPVVDSGAPVSEEVSARQPSRRANAPVTSGQSAPADSGVMVMVPQQSSEPLQTYGAPDVAFSGGSAQAPAGGTGQWTPPAQSAPSARPGPATANAQRNPVKQRDLVSRRAARWAGAGTAHHCAATTGRR